LRDVSQDHIKRKYEVCRRAILPKLAINPCLHPDALPRIQSRNHHWTNRAEGVETLGTRPLAVFILEIARGDVIDAGITEDEFPNILPPPNSVAPFSDHNT
jgi:hypothetical protein